MYAVVATGGKQLKVEKGAEAVVERLDAEVGQTVELPVVFVADGDSVVTGAGATSAAVTAEVIEHFAGDKVLVFKFKRRKGYKRTRGHRQQQTRIRVTEIVVGEAGRPSKKASPAKAAAPEKDTKVTAAVEAQEAKKAPEAPEAAKAATPEAAKATEAPEAAGQCAATKANGERCANRCKEGSDYCGVHAKKYES